MTTKLWEWHTDSAISTFTRKIKSTYHIYSITKCKNPHDKKQEENLTSSQADLLGFLVIPQHKGHEKSSSLAENGWFGGRQESWTQEEH